VLWKDPMENSPTLTNGGAAVADSRNKRRIARFFRGGIATQIGLSAKDAGAAPVAE